MARLQKILVLAAAFTMASSAFAELSCNAVYRKVIPPNHVVETVTPLKKTYQNGGIQKFEVDLEQGVYMAATYTQGRNEVMLSLIQAPDYMDGVITRAALNDGRASLGQTVMETQLFVSEGPDGKAEAKEVKTGNLLVYRLECAL